MATSTLTKTTVSQQVQAATCDRHPTARAQSRARLAQHELFLCGHCTATHLTALEAASWDIIIPGDK